MTSADPSVTRISNGSSPRGARAHKAPSGGAVSLLAETAAVKTETRAHSAGLSIAFTGPNTVVFTSAALFRDSDGPLARELYLRAFRATGVQQVAIDPGQHKAEIVLDSPIQPRDARLSELAKLLSATHVPAAAGSALVLPE